MSTSVSNHTKSCSCCHVSLTTHACTPVHVALFDLTKWPFIHRSIYPCICLSIYPSIYHCIHLSIYISLSIHPRTCLHAPSQWCRSLVRGFISLTSSHMSTRLLDSSDGRPACQCSGTSRRWAIEGPCPKHKKLPPESPEP